jgi:hypothetical protein
MLGFFYTNNLHILPLDIVCVSDYKSQKKKIWIFKNKLLNSQKTRKNTIILLL